MRILRRGLLLISLVAVAGIAARAGATGIDCGPGGTLCAITVQVEGGSAVSGNFSIDPTTGDISLASTVTATSPDGGHIYVTNINGNADPILGFAFSASTVAGNAFSATFTLPIALAGTISANSSIGYVLTGTSVAGAQVTPLFGKVLIAQEVDTTVGGLLPLNKGVNAGDTFACSPGPCNVPSPIYTASNTFTGNLAYDLMSITIAFSLSPSSNVGMSGFVQQLAVPEPTTLVLLGAGIVALGVARRRAA